MSSRKPQPEALKPGTVKPEHLPPQRPPKSISKQVRPPLAGMSLSTFIYILVGLAAVYLGVQSLNIANWSILGKSNVSHSASAATDAKDSVKSKLHDSFGKQSSVSGVSGNIPRATDTNGILTIEQRIEDLASALGMPAGDLAGAIAVAVREFVPPATLSSISSQAKATPHGTLVDVLLGQTSSSAADGQPTAPGGIGGILDSVIGMDEPPSEDA